MLKINSNSSRSHAVIISLAKIEKAEDISGKEISYLKRTYDIGLSLTLDVDKSFKPTLTIAGNFRRPEGTAKIDGWGSAFVVRDLLSRLGYEGELNTDHSLPAEALQFLEGKEILRLSYLSGIKPNGKPKYSDWSQVGTVAEGTEALLKRFENSVAQGFPKNYHPELQDKTGDTSFPSVTSESDVI